MLLLTSAGLANISQTKWCRSSPNSSRSVATARCYTIRASSISRTGTTKPCLRCLRAPHQLKSAQSGGARVSVTGAGILACSSSRACGSSSSVPASSCRFQPSRARSGAFKQPMDLPSLSHPTPSRIVPATRTLRLLGAGVLVPRRCACAHGCRRRTQVVVRSAAARAAVPCRLARFECALGAHTRAAISSVSPQS
jgi:hypothetical protein